MSLRGLKSLRNIGVFSFGVPTAYFASSELLRTPTRALIIALLLARLLPNINNTEAYFANKDDQ